MEGVLLIKNLSLNLFSSFNGGSVGDQEFASQSLHLLQWREYWWSRTYLPDSSVSSMEGMIGDQERTCQTLQLLQRREYLWSGTCMPNSSVCSMEGVLVIKNVSVKLFSFFNGGSIDDQERVCQTLQSLQWRDNCWSRNCLSNCTSSSM